MERHETIQRMLRSKTVFLLRSQLQLERALPQRFHVCHERRIPAPRQPFLNLFAEFIGNVGTLPQGLIARKPSSRLKSTSPSVYSGTIAVLGKSRTEGLTFNVDTIHQGR